MVNLLDLCAVALPLGTRADGLPFGVQLLAPAFADQPLFDLGALLLGEPTAARAPLAADRSLLAVCGAHLAGQPLNPILLEAGARLHRRARTAAGYRMVCIAGSPARPGLIDDGTGPDDGLEVELWDAPFALVQQLAVDVASPLQISTVRLADGAVVPGFTAIAAELGDAADITPAGSWRAYLAATES